MELHDPSRLKLSPVGRPCWLESNTTVGSLDIFPLAAEDQFEIITWAKARNGEGYSRVVIELPGLHLRQLLEDWRADPELALRHWFQREPPGKETSRRLVLMREPGQVTETSAEDLGL